jgi:hypothetical protein
MEGFTGLGLDARLFLRALKVSLTCKPSAAALLTIARGGDR